MTAPRARKYFPVWFVALCILLLAWCGSLLYLKFPRHVPSTGDALLDAYLAVANDEGMVPMEAISTMEERFGKDPRLWELLYSTWSIKAQRSQDDLRFAEHVELARKGERPISTPLLSSYISNCESRWRREIYDSNYKPIPYPSSPTPAQMVEREAKEVRAVSLLVDKNHAADRNKLFAELLAEAADYSVTYYRLARLEWGRNNYEAAIARIREGNLQPHCFYYSFPASAYVSSLSPDSSLGKHPQIRFVAGYGFSLSRPFFHDIHQSLCLEAISKDDRRGLQTLHEMACRLGTECQSGIYPGVAYALIHKFAANEASTRLLGLTQPQQLTLKELETLLDRQLSEIQWIESNSPSARYIASHQGLLGLLERNRPSDYVPPERRFRNDVWCRAQYNERVIPLYGQIEKFDFVSMSFLP